MGENCCIDIVELSGSYAPSCNSSLRPTTCIYIVDKRIRNQKPDAYTPDTVSIGPYHRDKDKKNLQMQAMEALKSRYAEALIVRTGISRENYMEAIKLIKPEPREYYFDPINLPHEEDFLEVMLLDGLFIIELFCKYANVVGVDVDDPIFYSNLKRTRVIRDLALLENQIPMSVLQALFEKSQNGDSSKLSLVELALYFFDALIPDGKGKYTSSKKNGSNVEHKHLLDLLSFTLETQLPPQNERLPTSTPESLPCVKELRDCGVQFKRGLEYGSLMDLQFNKNGVFAIPPICISDFTDPFFRNLIAYEQHRFKGRHCMTSYVILMAYLINSAADVAVLRDCDIISNHLGDVEKIASLFSTLCCEIFTDKFIYGELSDDIRVYYRLNKNEWRDSVRQEVSKSPWGIIPMVAAVTLLLLSIWSALFAAFPLFNVNFKH